MSDRVAAVTKASSPSIEPITFAWNWRATPIRVGYEVSGPTSAEPILLLPAMSTVSTRGELRALAHHLGTRRSVVTDWPGFGDTPRPRLDYDRELCRGFLEELVGHLQRELKRPSFPVIACGHAGQLRDRPRGAAPWDLHHLVLIAPTWRGPLPTMMSGRKPIQGRIRKLIHAPVIGELLYRLNVSRPVVRMMYRRHVFADPAFLTDDLLGNRMRITPPAGRPLCFGLLRHWRPRPVRRPGLLSRRGRAHSASDADALRPRYATQVSGRNGSARGPAGGFKVGFGARHPRNAEELAGEMHR